MYSGYDPNEAVYFLQSRVLSSRHALNDAVFEEEYPVRDYAIHAPGGLVLELEELTLSGRGNSVYMCYWCYYNCSIGATTTFVFGTESRETESASLRCFSNVETASSLRIL